jgi:hypothetical protein
MTDHHRVYTAGGEKVHLLSPLDSPNQSSRSLCGRTPAFGDYWHGTGSQEEHDTAARRPLCTRCEKHTAPTSTKEN